MGNYAAKYASKTYRNVVNKTAKALRVDPIHTKYPSEDFDSILAVMDEKSQKRALEFYRLGLRRGYDKATTDVANGILYFENEKLIFPKDKITITVHIRFTGCARRTEKFKFSANDLGFK